MKPWTVCSLPGSSVHGILQARILEWAAISFSRGSSPPSDQMWFSCIAGRFFTIQATREASNWLLKDRCLGLSWWSSGEDCVSKAGGLSSILSQGSKIPQTMQNGEKKKQTNKKSVGEVEKHKQRVLTQGVWEMGSESS